MTRDGRWAPGAQIYHQTLYPTVPADGWGRFMRLTTGQKIADELWRIREAARKLLAPELLVGSPVQHLCVVAFQGHEPGGDASAGHNVLCLACTWLGSASGPAAAVSAARQHAIEAVAPDAKAEIVNHLGFRAWQYGDARPCAIELGEGRHHAHSLRLPEAGGNFAVCTTCAWRQGPFYDRTWADHAAGNHPWELDGPPRGERNLVFLRGSPCGRPFPPPARILTH